MSQHSIVLLNKTKRNVVILPLEVALKSNNKGRQNFLYGKCNQYYTKKAHTHKAQM